MTHHVFWGSTLALGVLCGCQAILHIPLAGTDTGGLGVDMYVQPQSGKLDALVLAVVNRSESPFFIDWTGVTVQAEGQQALPARVRPYYVAEVSRQSVFWLTPKAPLFPGSAPLGHLLVPMLALRDGPVQVTVTAKGCWGDGAEDLLSEVCPLGGAGWFRIRMAGKITMDVQGP
jgi:hypothetical protein